jgi:hypothetical protein
MQMLRRRATATGVPVDSLIKMLVNFATTAQLENIRYSAAYSGSSILGLPFGPAARARLHLLARFGGTRAANMPSDVAPIARLLLLKFVITRNAAARMYEDTALTVTDDEETTLDLRTNTTGAHPAVTHLK